jgi:hypothetical protein
MTTIGKHFIITAAALSTGCIPFTGPDCIDENRSLAVAARLTSSSPQPQATDTGSTRFSMSEARNHRSRRTTHQYIIWFVGSGLVRSNVTAVHLHEQATGRLLFNVPIDTTFGPAFVVTQVLQAEPYRGTVPWNELYDILGNGRAYVDIHTRDQPNGQLRGTLVPEYPNWRDFVHSYCS